MNNYISKNNLTIITSVIKTSDKELYCQCRSVFTHNERYIQTLNTIYSIKKYSPNTYIVLAEASDIPKEWEDELKKIVDYYFNISNTKYKKYVDSKSKAFGESSILLSYLTSEHFISNKNNFNSISKLSGRYYLEPNFINYSDIIKNNSIIVSALYDLDQIYTIWFCMQIKEVDDFISVLERAFNNIDLINYSINIEKYLYTHWIKSKEHFNINYIGVSGQVATYGDLLKI